MTHSFIAGGSGRHWRERDADPRSSVREMAGWRDPSTLPRMVRWPQLAFRLGERLWSHQPLEPLRVRCQRRLRLIELFRCLLNRGSRLGQRTGLFVKRFRVGRSFQGQCVVRIGRTPRSSVHPQMDGRLRQTSRERGGSERLSPEAECESRSTGCRCTATQATRSPGRQRPRDWWGRGPPRSVVNRPISVVDIRTPTALDKKEERMKGS